MAAAEAQDEREFAWIGMNLLLRYPLRGETGRRSSGPEFEQSDLLLYWFLHASLVELDGFWQQELFRILGRVFRRSEALGAVDLVKSLRRGEADINDYPDPSEGKTGGVYNALNQVMVHGSLSHMLFTRDRQDSPYFLDTRENWWYLNDDHRDLIRLALGEPKQAVPNGCAMPAPLTQRMPAAQSFSDEEEYFAYAGAAVDTLVVAEEQAQGATTPAVEYEGETVWLLTADRHFTRLDATTVVGPVNALCVLSLEQRVVLSDELGYTYIVEEKQLTTDEVRVRLRRARPILDREYVVSLFEETEDA